MREGVLYVGARRTGAVAEIPGTGLRQGIVHIGLEGQAVGIVVVGRIAEIGFAGQVGRNAGERYDFQAFVRTTRRQTHGFAAETDRLTADQVAGATDGAQDFAVVEVDDLCAATGRRTGDPAHAVALRSCDSRLQEQHGQAQ